jgi:tetratricopeptide (TPR) repeat protein
MEIDPETHRQLGIDLFNLTWSYLDKAQRSADENDAMLHAAHASRHHWAQVGQPVNLARGEWQISRVYAVLGRYEPALYHGQRCLDICQQNQITDFDLAYAYEALARAYAVAQQWDNVRSNLDLATSAGNVITDPADKDWFFKDLATILIPGSEED